MPQEYLGMFHVQEVDWDEPSDISLAPCTATVFSNQVLGSTADQGYRSDNLDCLENQFASVVTTLLQSNAFARTLTRSHLLRRFNGDITDVEKFLRNLQERQNQSHLSRDEQREIFRKKYASELAAVGLNVQSPCVLDQLEKHHGDVNKVWLEHRTTQLTHHTLFQ